MALRFFFDFFFLDAFLPFLALRFDLRLVFLAAFFLPLRAERRARRLGARVKKRVVARKVRCESL